MSAFALEVAWASGPAFALELAWASGSAIALELAWALLSAFALELAWSLLSAFALPWVLVSGAEVGGWAGALGSAFLGTLRVGAEVVVEGGLGVMVVGSQGLGVTESTAGVMAEMAE